MRYAEGLEWGTSLSTFKGIDYNLLKTIAENGISNVELSFDYNYYFNVIDFPANARSYKEMAKKAGVRLYSLHLPFSGILDISNPNGEMRSIAIYTFKTLIRAAAEAGISVIVLHPSSEPIADDKRSERMAASREAIILLNKECEQCGLKLAVENLPRTCLCRTSDEMIALLSGTGAGVVFDTNHALLEDNIHFLNAIIDSDLKLHSLHISDYFKDENGVLDERHTLPGMGINNWNGILDSLERANYAGPLMYEISCAHSPEKSVDAADLANNMKKLSHYEL